MLWAEKYDVPGYPGVLILTGRSGGGAFLACRNKGIKAIDDRVNFSLVLPQLVN
jgi:hypothetical protein